MHTTVNPLFANPYIHMYHFVYHLLAKWLFSPLAIVDNAALKGIKECNYWVIWQFHVWVFEELPNFSIAGIIFNIPMSNVQGSNFSILICFHFELDFRLVDVK